MRKAIPVLVLVAIISLNAFVVFSRTGRRADDGRGSIASASLARITNPDVGYYDSTGAFIAVTQGQVKTFLQGLRCVSAKSRISAYYVASGTDSATDEPYVSLMVFTTDGPSRSLVRCDLVRTASGACSFAEIGGATIITSCKSLSDSGAGYGITEGGYCECTSPNAPYGVCDKNSGVQKTNILMDAPDIAQAFNRLR